MDGANIVIREEIRKDNMLTFGLLTPEIDSAHSKMRHGEYKFHDDCLLEAIGQTTNTVHCGSDISGPIVNRNSINLLSSGLVMYTMLTLLFLIEIRNKCQIGTPNKFP